VRELVGDGALEAIEVEDTNSGERRRLDARALFVFIGAAPYTRWLEGQLALDSGGYVLTGADANAVRRDDEGQASLLETSRPGVFAAGDVRSGSIMRVAAAVGEGATAVRLVYDNFQNQT
jgi:thioredoxin reductase (NADPH)